MGKRKQKPKANIERNEIQIIVSKMSKRVEETWKLSKSNGNVRQLLACWFLACCFDNDSRSKVHTKKKSKEQEKASYAKWVFM